MILKTYWSQIFMNNCIFEIDDKLITNKENNRTFKINNQEQKKLLKYHIDKCLIKNIQNQKACDYGLKNKKEFYDIGREEIKLL